MTEFGLGPDKWATAWLLTRHVAPGAKLVVVDADAPMPEGTAFDVPGAHFQRVGNRASFEVVQAAYGVADPDIQRLAAVVHDIEVSFWVPDKTAEAPLVEHAFRMLQRGQAQEVVTPDCYVAFFDSVHRAIHVQRTEGKAMSVSDLSVTCEASAIEAPRASLVPEIAIPDLLTAMKHGKSVVFVDVREANEFQEAHIPGAINVTLRDLDADTVARVEHADYVVSYCVKDFRGFEMAKALRQAGVHNAVILKPYGMKGWLAQGLPMVGTQALDEPEATAQMNRCVHAADGCLNAANRQ
ncbi:MAG: chromate resistance protein ChrB domain-containing protein [Luteimonas sp.]